MTVTEKRGEGNLTTINKRNVQSKIGFEDLKETLAKKKVYEIQI